VSKVEVICVTVVPVPPPEMVRAMCRIVCFLL
jgi:hypothetical protein